jgi:hypothetical protein
MNKVTCSAEVLRDKINTISNQSDPDLQALDSLKVQLKVAEENEQQILAVKAGVRWREEGERSTRYFLNRFKTRQESTELTALRGVGDVIYNQIGDIINYVKMFYAGLYSNGDNSEQPPDWGSFFENCPVLDPVQAGSMARPLTVVELEHALKTCKESAPGLDGIPYSFYKAFSGELLPLLLRSWEQARESGSLTYSHRRACIILIPKKAKIYQRLGIGDPFLFPLVI